MIGSGVGRVPVGGLGAYPPSKAATRSAASVLRRELKPDGIAVTYVDPGVVDTVFMSRAGMPGAPATLLVTPEDVARKILLAIPTRPRILNAVPWQTAFVALAELFPRVTDFVLERNPALVGTGGVTGPRAIGAVSDEAEAGLHVPAAPAPALSAPETTANAATPEPPADAAASEPQAFDAAVEPVRRRMERVKLKESFVRDLLREGTSLDPNEVALRWAGMPNKNERAVTIEVLDALVEARFLARDGEHYRVLRGPD
jgi:hypothetical protein